MSVSRKDRSSAAGPVQSAPRCNCSALRQAARRVTQFYDHALAPTGLRVTQLPILRILSEQGPLPMGALADAMVMDRATLGHNLRPLEGQGLVDLRPGADKRVKLVALTDAGARKLAEAIEPWRAAQSRFEDAFGRDAALALRAALARVASLELGGR